MTKRRLQEERFDSGGGPTSGAPASGEPTSAGAATTGTASTGAAFTRPASTVPGSASHSSQSLDSSPVPSSAPSANIAARVGASTRGGSHGNGMNVDRFESEPMSERHDAQAVARRSAHSPQPLIARETRDVVDAVREAGAAGRPLRIRAGGGWLDAARPADGAPDVLDVGELRGILEYTPGDLTITVRAGTTLAEIDEATRQHGQWLPLDPFGSVDNTLGATLATASCGPLAASLGLPRDLALGVEFVDGRGVVVRGGGRVVKNVAGFDLVRLTIGAWGTLGVITEATMRLRARPQHVATIGLRAPRDAARLSELLRQLRAAAIAALACELVDAGLARSIGAGSGADDMILVRISGNAAALVAQRDVLLALDAGVRDGELADDIWERLRRAIPPDAFTLRCSQRPSMLAELWHHLRSIAPPEAGTICHATLERGVARIVVPPDAAPVLKTMLPDLSSRWRVVGERLPADLWSQLPVTRADKLSEGIRHAFDPLRLLNPGLTSPRA